MLTGYLTAAVIAVLLAWLISLCAFRLIARNFPARTQACVAFFHPSAHGGGGGERVLWEAVDEVSAAFPHKKVYIYCEAGHSREELLASARRNFDITVNADIRVLPLHKVHLLQPSRWPRATLLGQAYGSVVVAAEALALLVPEVWMDTTGWAFPYALVWLVGSKIACYVHYPTISTDMLLRVRGRQATYNNAAAVAASPLLSALKLLYYNAFALLYGALGSLPAVVMVNSRWTEAHVRTLWWGAWRRRPRVVHPPCHTAALAQLPLLRPLKSVYLCSVAQFRPEKNHRQQLEALALAKRRMQEQQIGDEAARSVGIKFVGGCRNAEDDARLVALQRAAEELGVADAVEFHRNATYAAMARILSGAIAGLHSMVDEHFGISVVECMAAGCVPIAHNSGGPRTDIVVPDWHARMVTSTAHPVGFLAASTEEYAQCIIDVVTMEEGSRMELAASARRRSALFSSVNFRNGFRAAMQDLLK